MPDNIQQVADVMACAMARLLEDGQRVFHGVSSHLPMVAMLLARRMQAPNLTHLDIAGGVNPTRASSAFSSAGSALYDSGEAYFPLCDVFDLSMRGGLDVAFLSGVQFDAAGQVNASVIGEYDHPKVRLPGGAGSAVLIPTAKRVILWRSVHNRRTFVEWPDFVTAKGNAWRLVTPLCVFAFAEGRWELESLHSFSSLEEVRENTAFPVICQAERITPPPSREEARLLRMVDPQNLRCLEFK